MANETTKHPFHIFCEALGQTWNGGAMCLEGSVPGVGRRDPQVRVGFLLEFGQDGEQRQNVSFKIEGVQLLVTALLAPNGGYVLWSEIKRDSRRIHTTAETSWHATALWAEQVGLILCGKLIRLTDALPPEYRRHRMAELMIGRRAMAA